MGFIADEIAKLTYHNLINYDQLGQRGGDQRTSIHGVYQRSHHWGVLTFKDVLPIYQSMAIFLMGKI